MFIGDFEKTAPWNTASIKGSKRFLERVWELSEHVTPEEGYRKELEPLFHKTIKKVSEDILSLKMNTAIAAMMTLLNEIAATGSVTRGELATYLTLLNPFAPHITEEMWQQAGFKGQLAHGTWPQYEEDKCKEEMAEMAVQVNGKVRGRFTAPADISEDEAVAKALAIDSVAAALEGKQIVKRIYVPGKLVNLAAK
jgi:leucyl-tRNA synthetase